jgi:serine O-acetyltransferase
MLKQDLERSYDLTHGKPVRRVVECYRSPGVHAVVVFRFGQWLLRQPVLVRILLKPIYALWNHRTKAKWGIMIAPGAVIGQGLHIFHFGGIFIGEQVVIGENCSISHDVTIGLAGEGRRRGAPTIGKNVYIAPGAKIAGRIRVGDNVRIGANAVVSRDVPDNALVQVQSMQVVTFPGFYGGSREDLPAGAQQESPRGPLTGS